MQHFMKKAAALALAMVMALSLASVAFAADFPDMPDDWSTAALEAAVENGLISGKDGKIAASDSLTRAEMATIITRAFNAEVEDDISFTDVKNDTWYKTYAAKAVHMGAMNGKGSAFAGADSITRQEVFVVLARVLKLADGDAADLAAFSDADKTASWAVPAVAALVKAGYVSGSNGALNPTASITRAEFSQVMYNIFHNAYLTKAGTYEEVDGDNVIISSTNVTVKGVDVKGDVVVADGVGNGDVYFEDVTIGGRLVVRGGGMNSIHFKDSKTGTVIMSKVDGNVRLVITGESTVETVTVEAGKASTDVRVEGTVGTVVVNDNASTVVLADATVAKVEVNKANTTVSLAGKTVVAEMTVAAGATDTQLQAEPTTEITKLDTAEDVFINQEDVIKESNDEEKINPERPEESAAPSESKAPAEETGSNTTAHTHTFVKETVDQDGTAVEVDKATAFDAGRHSFECSVCHEIVLRAHTWNAARTACTVCSASYVDQDPDPSESLPAASADASHSVCTGEHKFEKKEGFYTVTSGDGCNSDLVETYTCVNTNESKPCAQTKVVTTPATGHSYDAGVVTTQPTCAAAGERTYTCTKCAAEATGHTKTSPIAQLDHKTGGWKSDNTNHWKVCSNTTVHQTPEAQKVETAAHTFESISATQHRCTVCGKTLDHAFNPSTHVCPCGATEAHEYVVGDKVGTTQHKLVCNYDGCTQHPEQTVSCTFNKPGHKCECGNTDTSAHIEAAARYTKVDTTHHKVTCSIEGCTTHPGTTVACTYTLNLAGTEAGTERCVCGQLATAHKLSTAWTQIEGQEKHQHVCVCGDPSCTHASASGTEACTYTNGVCAKCGRVKPCTTHTYSDKTAANPSGVCSVCGAVCAHTGTEAAQKSDTQHWKACTVCGKITKAKANHVAGAYATTPTGDPKVHTADCTGKAEYGCTHTYTQACGEASCTVTGCTVKAAADAAGGGGG